MNTTITPPNLFFRELRPSDRANALSLGAPEHAPLKTFLKKDALTFHIDNIAKTYVLIDSQDSPRIWGYISLMCSELTLDAVHRQTKGESFRRYKTYPAVKLARLAIDKSLQGKGYGLGLVRHAISIARDSIMPNVGCRFFVVDSKADAIPFYEKVGFIMLASEDNKKKSEPLMLLDLHHIN